jgi:hypothetical protein
VKLHPPKGVLRLGAGNIYVANPKPAYAVDVALDWHPHSWGWAEMGTDARLARREGAQRDYHALTAFGFEDMRDANDCIMHVRKALNVRHFSMTQVCDDANPDKLAHDRTFSMLAYEAPWLGKVGGDPAVACHIAIHPNWVTGFRNPDAPIVREYVDSMRALDAMLRFADAMGWLTTVTGDFNLPKRQGDRAYLTSYDVFEAYRMRVKMEHIDGIAYDRRLDLVDWAVVHKARTKSDHPWVLGDFERVA